MRSRYVQEWVQKAEEDFEVATLLLRRRTRHYDAICFHAHQSVEKYFKAFLVAHRQRIPRTHDVVRLGEAATRLDGDFILIQDLMHELNPFAVEVRYPGESATASEARWTVKAATEVRALIRRKLRLK